MPKITTYGSDSSITGNERLLSSDSDNSTKNISVSVLSSYIISQASGLYIPFLSDPNQDAIVFWDDSAGLYANLTIGSGLSVSGTEISLDTTGLVVLDSSNTLSDSWSVRNSLGAGISVNNVGGSTSIFGAGVGNQSAIVVAEDSVTIIGFSNAEIDSVGATAALTKGYGDANYIPVFTDPNEDAILFWDDSAGEYTALTLGTNLSITGTVLNASGGGGGGAGELSDLTDVNTSTPTNRNVLIADGTDWESRSLTEADISDLGSYLTTGSNEISGSSFVISTDSNYNRLEVSPSTSSFSIRGGSSVSAYSQLSLSASGVNIIIDGVSHYTFNDSGTPSSNNDVITKEYADANYSSGSGDVLASANITDNTIVRGDGGVKGVQDSGVSIDDSDNISGVGNLTMSGNLIISGTVSGKDASKMIVSDTTGVTGADAITNIISLTQSEYDAITPDSSTYYVITDPDPVASDYVYVQIACGNLTDSITTGTNKGFDVSPVTGTIEEVWVDLFDAGTSTGITVDINVEGSTILSTKLTTDATEDTSATASTAAVISSASITERDRITIDFDAVPTDAIQPIITLKILPS